MPDRLTFESGHRQRTRCDYQDYVVNGKRLADTLKIGDFIPPFGWLSSEVESSFAEMLLKIKPSDLRAGRIPLFVCPECVDYGCGVGTCRVEIMDGIVTWKDFGWETNYDDELNQEPVDRELVLRFDEDDYRRLLDQFTNRREQADGGNKIQR